MKTDQSLVSIAMCTYNGEKFLQEQLESILNQTYTNIELNIVDDCSTDRTKEILNNYKATDSRIKLYSNETNIGYNKNFEKALKLCTGEYLMISDQDDIWLNDKIQTLIDNIKNNLLIYCNSQYIDQNSVLLGKCIIDKSNDVTKRTHYKNILLQNFITGHNIMIKRDALSFILPFPRHSFYDWWIGFVTLYERRVAYIDKVLTHYRVHELSVITELNLKKNSTNKHQLETLEILNHLQDFQTYKNLKPDDKTLIKKLEVGFLEKANSYFAISLFIILYKNFKTLFPNYSKPIIKQFAFLIRYCRGLSFIQMKSTTNNIFPPNS